MGKPETLEHLGMKTWMVSGRGKDPDGKQPIFLMYLIALPDGNMADVWYSVYVADKEGMDPAKDVLGFFRTP